MTFVPGQSGHADEHNNIRTALDGRLSETQLAATFGAPAFDVEHAPYSADPTGASSSQTAIQDALDAAGASSIVKAIRLRPGARYLVDNLAVPSGVTILGWGATLVRSTVTTSTALAYATIHNENAGTGADEDIAVYGVSFDQTASGQGRHVGFREVTRLRLVDINIAGLETTWASWFIDCHDVTIDRWTQDTRDSTNPADGIHINGGSYITISNSVIHSHDDCIALHLNSSDGSDDLTDVTVTNCTLHCYSLGRPIMVLNEHASKAIKRVTVSNIVGLSGPSASMGVTVQAISTGIMEDIGFSNVVLTHGSTSGTSDAFSAQDVDRLALSNVTVKDARRNGFYMDTVAGLSMVGCSTDGTSTTSAYAAVLVTCPSPRIVGNRFDATGSTTGAAINLNQSHNASVLGNTFVCPDYNGVLLNGCTYGQFIGNTFEDVTTGFKGLNSEDYNTLLSNDVSGVSGSVYSTLGSNDVKADQISLGATDSGGTGYRALIVPN